MVEKVVKFEDVVVDSNNDDLNEVYEYNNPLNTSTKVTLEECSIVYYAGYLAKRCIEYYKCVDCEANLLTQVDIEEPN